MKEGDRQERHPRQSGAIETGHAQTVGVACVFTIDLFLSSLSSYHGGSKEISISHTPGSVDISEQSGIGSGNGISNGNGNPSIHPYISSHFSCGETVISHTMGMGGPNPPVSMAHSASSVHGMMSPVHPIITAAMIIKMILRSVPLMCFLPF